MLVQGKVKGRNNSASQGKFGCLDSANFKEVWICWDGLGSAFGISLCFRTGEGRSCVCPGVYYGMALHRDLGCAEVTPGAALSRAQCWLLSSPVPSQPHQMFVPWEKIFLEGWGKCSWRVGAGQQEEMELPCSSATFPRTCRRCCLSQVPQWGAWGEISQPEKPSEPPGLWGNRIPLPYLLMEGRGGGCWIWK